MLRKIPILQIIYILAFCCSLSIPLPRAWKYEFVSFVTNSSDETRLKFDVKVKRISRGVYGVQGTIYINIDIEVGDNTMTQASIYRSVTGSSEFHPTPFIMKKQHVYDFLNNYYKDIFMNSVAGCSNFPVFKNKFQPPLEKKTYVLNSCTFSNEGLPPIMPLGYYKLIFIGSGNIDYVVEAISKMESAI